tara:strand:+ start:386 stop:592 length:207 start_codon:yes stop_codon:yes gene_type:complete
MNKPLHALSEKTRKVFGIKPWEPRQKQPGEAPPRTIAHQPWAPMPELRWSVRESGLEALELPSRGTAA